MKQPSASVSPTHKVRSRDLSNTMLGYKINEKATAHLGFNYGFPIKQASSVVIADDDNNTTDVALEIKYNFKTFSLTGNYRFIGLTKQPVVSMTRTAQDLFLSATKRI